jgi:hypothetical protein
VCRRQWVISEGVATATAAVELDVMSTSSRCGKPMALTELQVDDESVRTAAGQEAIESSSCYESLAYEVKKPRPQHARHGRRAEIARRSPARGRACGGANRRDHRDDRGNRQRQHRSPSKKDADGNRLDQGAGPETARLIPRPAIS